MSWIDRLREAAYTAPDGTRATFSYVDVRRSVNKKTTVFEFADSEQVYVQDQGTGSRRFPLRVFFSGADYDQDAAAFETLLWQRGAGTLEHPIYGQQQVVPTGEIQRRDDLTTAGNQAVIDVELFRTTDLLFPSRQDLPGADVLASVDAFNEAAAAGFARLAEVDLAADRADLQGTNRRLLDNVQDTIAGLAAAADDVQEDYDDTQTSINRGIDILIRDPLSLAAQVVQLTQAPARARQSITARLDGYRNLADSIIGGRAPSTRNQLAADDLYLSASVTGSVLSTVNHQFDTRGQAFDAADEVIDQFEAAQAYREEAYRDTGNTDTGESYLALQQAVATVAGFLVEVSFDLAAERAIVTDRPRTMIDLCAELYGEVDERLDFFAETNRLTGDELLEIPAGRRIVYYP
jgi:hypothetical protein